MFEMHLRQPRSTYSACGPFTKNKEIIQKFKETNWIRLVLNNDLAHRDFKDLTRRTASDKRLGDKVFNIAKKTKYDGYQCVLA